MPERRSPHTKGRILRALAIALTLAVAGIVVTACGSSSSSSTSGSTGASSGASTAASAAAGDCMKTAQANVAAATADLKPPSPGPKVDVTPVAGKAVWLISPLVNPLTTAVEEGFRAGSKLAGIKGVVFEGKGTTASWTTGISEAASQHAGIVILYGIDEELVSGALKQAKAAGVKVIDAVTGDPTDPLPDNVYAHVSANFTKDGAIDADYILTQSGCKANVGIFYAPVFQVHKNLNTGATDEIKKLCPSCSSTSQSVDVTTAATKVTPQVATLLRSHPNINYLFPVYDQIVPYTNSAIKQVRPSVKVVSHDGVFAQLDAVRAGNTPQIADISFPPIQWIGWELVNASVRVILNQPPGNTEIPARLITKENAGASNDTLFPAFSDLPGIFGPAWGK